MIAKNFKLELAAGHRVWPVQKVTLRPDNGLPMIPRLRSKPAPAREHAPAYSGEPLTAAMQIG
jgi:hypothetical protein